MTLWSPKDFDFIWFLDAIFYIENYYSMLSQCKTLKEKNVIFKKMAEDENLNNVELVMEFAMLSLNAFKIITWIIQHFCARVTQKQVSNIVDALEKGVFVLYDYVYYYWAGANETVIISSVFYQLPEGVSIVTFEDAFSKGYQQFKESSKNRHRSVDYDAPAIFVDVKSGSFLSEEVSKVIVGSNVDSGVNISFLGFNNVNGSRASNNIRGLTDVAKTEFTRQTKTVPLSPEVQEKLFPKKWIPATNPMNAYKYLFTRKYGDTQPIPEFIIKVPWSQATGILSRQENFFMEDGFVFLDYMQISAWMKDVWHSAVNNARSWDNKNIIWPWLDREGEAYKDVIPINVDMSHTEFVEYFKGFNERTFYVPLSQHLTNGLFFVEDDDNEGVEKPDASEVDHNKALCFLYRSVFDHGRKLEAMLRTRVLMLRRSAAESKSSSEIPSENEIFYQPLESNATGDFFKDYGRIMPPCIKSMYETFVNSRTHFRNEERLRFFQWAFKASVPLPTLLEMWSAMLDNDASIPQRERTALYRECSNIYNRNQRNRDAGNEFNYFGCAKMAVYCPFASQKPSSSSSIPDIEDLSKEIVGRKISCGNLLYDTKTPVPDKGVIEPRWPSRHLSRWSPMTATAVLSHYYLNKI